MARPPRDVERAEASWPPREARAAVVERTDQWFPGRLPCLLALSWLRPMTSTVLPRPALGAPAVPSSSGSGTRAAPSCLALAYGEGGDVVVKASSAVAQEIAVKSREQFAGRCRGLPAHPSCQGEEIAVAGAGLGDPVGIQKQQVAGGEVEGVDVVVIADQLREVEQWRRRG